jgi:hypothetical protein
MRCQQLSAELCSRESTEGGTPSSRDGLRCGRGLQAAVRSSHASAPLSSFHSPKWFKPSPEGRRGPRAGAERSRAAQLRRTAENAHFSAAAQREGSSHR